MESSSSIYEIFGVNRIPHIDDLFNWLEENGLSTESIPYRIDDLPDGNFFTIPKDTSAIALPIQRAERKTQSDLHKIEKIFENHVSHSNNNIEEIWEESKKIKDLFIDKGRIPSDALACYRPFHLKPFEEWGIYIFIDKLIPYFEFYKGLVKKRVNVFDNITLLSFILFEIFHHEFYHHIVETAATTLEVVLGGIDRSEPLYFNYLNYDYQDKIGCHPHDPLEEALANAYAFNSLSFLSRVGFGYKTLQVKVYQAILKKSWCFEPDGYKSAGFYTGSDYILGATHQLAMLLSSTTLESWSSALIAKNVLLNGHGALVDKPHVPLYLVGNINELQMFLKLIPAPIETCTSLYYPFSTSKTDAALRELKNKEKMNKKK